MLNTLNSPTSNLSGIFSDTKIITKLQTLTKMIILVTDFSLTGEENVQSFYQKSFIQSNYFPRYAQFPFG